MNTPVSFEIAKLLKEKEFNEETEYRWDTSFNGCELNCEEGFRNDWNNNYLSKPYYISAPTIAEVIMWFYEKHGIWISVYTMDKWLPNGNDREQLFDYSIKQMKLGLIDIPKKPEEFDSPTEAYEAAIEYTLKVFKTN